MEIKYPIIIIIVIIAIVAILFVKSKKKANNKKKVANTHYIKNTDLYKKIVRKYKLFTYIVFGLVIICLLAATLLSSRIVSVSKHNDEIYDRDIILCLDVSGSMMDLDKKIVDIYKDIIDGMNGERFGIVIFNSSSYTLLPLTNDYDYIKDVVETASAAFDAASDFTNTDYDLAQYIYAGTSEGEGSSIIGDGLATCVLGFPKLDEDRSRILILATDNFLAGKEIITVPEAGELAKKYKISIYPLDPYGYSNSEETKQLQDIAVKTGGKYYSIKDNTNTKDIIKEIEKKEKSLRETNPITVERDTPTLPLILLVSAILVLFVTERVVKL